MRGLPWRKRYGFTSRPKPGQRQMVVERRQSCGNLESDYRRRAATQAISQPDAPHGRNTTHHSTGIGSCRIRLEHQPSDIFKWQLTTPGTEAHCGGDRRIPSTRRWRKRSESYVKGGARWGHFGGTTFHRTFARLSLLSHCFGTVLAVKDSLRRAKRRRALDSSGPFPTNTLLTRGKGTSKRLPAKGPGRRQNGPFFRRHRQSCAGTYGWRRSARG